MMQACFKAKVQNKITYFYRNINDHCVFTMWDEIHDHVELISQKFSCTIDLIEIMHKKSKLHDKDLILHNICGKIRHKPTNCIFRDEVSNFVEAKNNDFGRFINMYSPVCNFNMCSSRCNTLFRAGSNSVAIQKVMYEALKMELVIDVILHMLVCCGYLHNKVSMRNPFLCEKLTSLKIFDATRTDESSFCEQSYQFSFEIFNFNCEFFSKLMDLRDIPSKLLLTVNKEGTLNFFVSLLHVEFDTNVEKRFHKFFLFFVDIINDSI